MTQQKAKMGRPTELTPDVQKQFVKYLSEGNYVETACALIGIRKQTVYNWLQQGHKEESGIYKDFLDAVEKAQAEAESRDLRAIRRAGAGDWKALAWRLERRHPTKWGRKDHLTAEVESMHVERHETVIEQNIYSDPETAELLRQLYRRRIALENDSH